jgi:hypothetical protein
MSKKTRLVKGAAFLSITAVAGLAAAHQLSGDPTQAVANTKPMTSATASGAPAGVGTSSAAAKAASATGATSVPAPAAPTAAHPTATLGAITARSGARIATNAPVITRLTPTAIPPITTAPPKPPTNTTTTTTTTTTRTTPDGDEPAGHVPMLGVYAGPDSKGVTGAAAFGAATGVQPQTVLDFAATDSWYNIAAPSWLISAHSGQSAKFELSLPLLPDGSQYTLAACASGAYDAQWQKTATNLINQRLANTIVRPGWEFNGNWYHWSAKNDIAGFVGCFRHVVGTMRSVPGQHFTFDWSPNIGANSFPAEQAYPGDAYVDYIGVDVYDYSWSRYPASSSGLTAAREAAWNDTINGDHGLAFWSRFAAAHHKSMALPEWGVATRSDGHGGGDNPAFIDHIFDFMQNPANNVAYAHYFNTYSASNDHSLTAGHLPASLAEYRHRALALP